MSRTSSDIWLQASWTLQLPGTETDYPWFLFSVNKARVPYISKPETSLPNLENRQLHSLSLHAHEVVEHLRALESINGFRLWGKSAALWKT